MILKEDSIFGLYVEELYFNINYYFLVKRKFLLFKVYVKNYDMFDIYVDIDEKYIMVCKFNGIMFLNIDFLYFIEEDNVYFVLELQDKVCDDNVENIMLVDNLFLFCFSVLGEW